MYNYTTSGPGREKKGELFEMNDYRCLNPVWYYFTLNWLSNHSWSNINTDITICRLEFILLEQLLEFYFYIHTQSNNNIVYDISPYYADAKVWFLKQSHRYKVLQISTPNNAHKCWNSSRVKFNSRQVTHLIVSTIYSSTVGSTQMLQNWLHFNSNYGNSLWVVHRFKAIS